MEIKEKKLIGFYRRFDRARPPDDTVSINKEDGGGYYKVQATTPSR